MNHRNRVSRCFLSVTLFMFLLTLAENVMPVADLDGIFHQSDVVVPEVEREGMLLTGTPHARIAIDGDANFSDTALLEGWPGDGSPENPFIIDGVDIDLGGRVGICITISNTQVSFIVSNCILTGAISDDRMGRGAGGGIYLDNVTNGELVNNTCSNNGIYLSGSGITLYESDSNTVANNTCNSNNEFGIVLYESDSNTVVNNTCSSNRIGIYIYESDSNTVARNTCNNNFQHGIYLDHSHQNTVSDNTCNNNRIGIYLNCSDFKIVINNMCTGNTEHDIYLYDSNAITGEFDPVILLLIGLVGITLLGAGWWAVSAKGDQDEIIVPARYRLVSLFRKRRPLEHLDVDETLEPDSSDQ